MTATSQVEIPTHGWVNMVLQPATTIESELLQLLAVVQGLRRVQIASLGETATPDEDLFEDGEVDQDEDFDFDGNDVCQGHSHPITPSA